MHQSGHERAHSMQTVQFSSLSAMTPRARAGGSSRSCGYCTVTVGFIIVLNVTPRPVSMPLICLRFHQNATFSTPVTRMLTSAIGISHFHASAWS